MKTLILVANDFDAMVAASEFVKQTSLDDYLLSTMDQMEELFKKKPEILIIFGGNYYEYNARTIYLSGAKDIYIFTRFWNVEKTPPSNVHFFSDSAKTVSQIVTEAFGLDETDYTKAVYNRLNWLKKEPTFELGESLEYLQKYLAGYEAFDDIFRIVHNAPVPNYVKQYKTGIVKPYLVSYAKSKYLIAVKGEDKDIFIRSIDKRGYLISEIAETIREANQVDEGLSILYLIDHKRISLYFRSNSDKYEAIAFAELFSDRAVGNEHSAYANAEMPRAMSTALLDTIFKTIDELKV